MPPSIDNAAPGAAPIQALRVEDLGADPAHVLERSEPLVLRGACADWPLVRAARESDTAFATLLASLDNGTAVDTLHMPVEAQGVVGYDADLAGFNYRHFRVSVTEALQRLAAYSRHAGPTPGLALQSALIADCLPGFVAGHRAPYLSPTVQPRLWIGNRVTTPTHFDASHNLAVVVCGRRRFTLFPPDQVGNLYIGPLDFAPTGAAISLARLDQLDDPRFPRLRQAMQHARVAELEPGDALVLPPLWWHHVESLAPLNALVNYWWPSRTTAGTVAEPGMGALYHALLALKALPPAEKAAWRALFEHYVFADEDPAAHIATERRGMLGAATPERAHALKEKVRKFL